MTIRGDEACRNVPSEAAHMCPNVPEYARLCRRQVPWKNEATDGIAHVLNRAVACVAVVIALCAGAVRADEGMWLPDRPPVEIWKQKYRFEPTPQWLEHARRSAINFGGASA